MVELFAWEMGQRPLRDKAIFLSIIKRVLRKLFFFGEITALKGRKVIKEKRKEIEPLAPIAHIAPELDE